jgi:hypothetical protein
MTANRKFVRFNGLAVEWGGFRRKPTDIGEQFLRRCESVEDRLVWPFLLPKSSEVEFFFLEREIGGSIEVRAVDSEGEM